MRLAVLRGPHTLEVTDVPIPEIEPDEVLVRVHACGVCTSELDLWEGHADLNSGPLFPGHEVSGIVEEAGAEVTTLREGDPVAVWVTGRGFADFVAAKAEHCLPAGDLPLELALAEPVACAVNAVELTDPRLADDVVLIGAGFMGNLVQKLVQLRGPRELIVADTRPDALERASALGATAVVDVRHESLVDVVRERTGGTGADVSFEVTGVQGPLSMLGDVTRMSGKIAIVGYHQGGTRELPLAQWNWMAFDVRNCHFREVSTIMRGMRVGMRLLTSGRLQLDDLVSHRYGLDEVNEAFATASRKPEGFVKATVATA
jgi:2-desacetyl-2-hydroxyethyl bacteriochlorophyllide A dehydrogenase